MFPCSPLEIPTLLLLVTCTIIFQPGSASPTLPRLILRTRFCCGSRTVLKCKISFRPFKGQYRGENFDSTLPPHRIFSNAPSCKPFAQFISDTFIDQLRTGGISLWGWVGEVPPPHLVMPLTVEPSKPRLCNDNRFLNL